jgi:hypothetical protein
VDIFQLTTESIPDTKVFLNPTGDAVEPVATWTCTVAAVDGGVRQSHRARMRLRFCGMVLIVFAFFLDWKYVDAHNGIE